METKKKIRLAMIGTNGIPANYGGCETLYENLTRELSNRFDMTVYCSNRQPRDKVGDTYLGAKLKYWPMSANGWQSIPYDYLSLLHAARHSDVMFVFGFGPWFMVWLMRLFGCKKKIVFNHGGLNEWLRESGKSALRARFGHWNGSTGRRLLKDKVVHVADNCLQVESLREFFGIEGVHVIRYGADQCVPVKPNKDLLEKYPFLDKEYYVAVARAQKDNNLHVLLEAFSKMPNKQLVLVSNFKVSEYGQQLYEQYKGKYPNMILIPGIYDKEELNAVRSNATAYIHSHTHCGTAPSLCEAMYLGLPIISFDMPVNHEVTNEDAFFFKDSDELVKIVENTSIESLKEVGAKTTVFARENYVWKHIANQYAEVFEQ